MIFRTIIETEPSSFELRHEDAVTLVGSCFTEHIGTRMRQAKFDCVMNPCGISYNPVSIAQMLAAAANGSPSDTDKMIERDGAFYHYDYHSSIVAEQAADLREKIQDVQHLCRSYLEKSATCFISLGTSIVHRLKSTGAIVSNCHKMPQALFEQNFLSHQEILSAVEQMISNAKAINPDIKIIFTVSPVRHTRHGLVANQRSKAALISCIHSVIDQSNDCHYFPSYEILQDDLRDYRFYSHDMIHPSAAAVDYIWAYLIDTSCSDQTKTLLKKINQINTRLHHRPLRDNPAKRRPFLEKLLADMQTLESEVPTIRYQDEKHMVEEELSALDQ